MAKTISQLPDATAVNGSDELIIQQSGVTKRATKTEVLAGIVNANIDAAAAIDGTKISPNFGSQNVVTTGSIGAGTSSPTSKLHVVGQLTVADSNGNHVDLIGRPSDDAAFVNFKDNAGALASRIGAVAGTIRFNTSGSTERLRIKAEGQVRFQPLASDPSNAEAGDVYYNSTSNKLRVRTNTAWVDLH